MARILCMVGPMTGLLRSSLELCRRLVADGHTVTLATCADWAAEADARGVSFERLPGAHDPMAARVDAGRALADRLAPDLMLVDLELHEQVIAALGAGRRLAVLNTWLGLDGAHGGGRAPPLHSALTPQKRVAIRAAWLRHRAYKMRRRLAERWRDRGADWRSSLVSLAREHGLDPRRVFDTQSWLYPFAYRDVPALCLHTEGMDFPGAAGASTQYVGPMIDRTPQVPGEVEAVFRKGAARLIYGGFGSVFTADTGLLARVFSAFKRQGDWRLILSRGGVDVALPPHPDNVHVFDWVPQWAVLERCDAAIIHGGINTIDECIDTLTPMLVYSGAITDMPGNAARVAHHRLGDIGSVATDTPEQIMARLEAVMADGDIAVGLTAMRSRARAYEASRTLESTVSRLVGV